MMNEPIVLKGNFVDQHHGSKQRDVEGMLMAKLQQGEVQPGRYFLTQPQDVKQT